MSENVAHAVVQMIVASREAAHVKLVDDEVLEPRRLERRPGKEMSSGTIEALRLAGSLRVSSELRTSRAAGSSVWKTSVAVGDLESVDLPCREPGNRPAPVVALPDERRPEISSPVSQYGPSWTTTYTASA